MNRAEKRQMDRLEMWFNSLSEDKKQKIYGIINDKINSNNNMMSAISDICTIGALDDVLDVDICKIKEVVTKTKEYLIEYGEYLEKNGDGGIKMIENEELRNEIKGKIRKYMKGKMDKARGLNLLKHEFNLPYAELSDLWIECKNGNYPKEIDRVPEKIESVVDENITAPVIKLDTYVNDLDKIQVEKKVSLKVIKVTTEVEGEYGSYIKTVDGVKIGDNLYSDKDMVRKEKIILAANYNTKMDAIREKIKVLNDELKEIQDLGMKEIERFTEIESVFDL